MSSSQSFSLSARVSSAYSELSSVAADLNAVSDALGKAVSDIDESLKKLNLGVEAWVLASSSETTPDDSNYEILELGYAKVSGKWGIALRTRSGDERYENSETEERWVFNEASRASRLAAIDGIPLLLNKLNKEAARVAKDLQEKLADARSVATAVKAASLMKDAEKVTDRLGAPSAAMLEAQKMPGALFNASPLARKLVSGKRLSPPLGYKASEGKQ